MFNTISVPYSSFGLAVEGGYILLAYLNTRDTVYKLKYLGLATIDLAEREGSKKKIMSFFSTQSRAPFTPRVGEDREKV